MTHSHQSEITITVLETTDIHGNIMPIQYANHKPTETGLAKLATLIRAERRKAEHMLLIDNGDLIQGTPLAYHHARLNGDQPNPMIACLNELDYDAAVVGNHEFNYGMGLLRKAAAESNFPWLCANITKETDGQPFLGKPYIIKTFGEVKVAVLGLTTPYIPNWEKAEHIAGLRFEDAVQTAGRWVSELRQREGADIVIVSYHGGFERHLETGEATEPQTGENQGYALCLEVDGIDLLLTGHQHRTIAGTKVCGVPVLQPGSAGGWIGKAVLRVKRDTEGRWRIADVESELLSPQGAPADSRILELAEPHERLTQVWLDQPIGRLVGEMRVLDPMDVRLREHPLIEFINRVQMDISGAPISNTALFDNISPGFPEHITMRDIVSNYIYPNTLQVIQVRGRDIEAALEQTAGYFETYHGQGDIRVSAAFSDPKPQHYNYDMWEGIEYTLDISKPVGQRVTKLRFQDAPLDPDGLYEVVMNNYRAAGGGNYAMFQRKPVVKDIPTDMAELLAGYIMERGTIEATLNRNWEVVWDGKPRE
ncbi:2',3'-cyclic-nucleotide 2'-phosphodiesterase / 3'-nucleotidase [Paenibacillus sp. UNCCL117]|uniref:bifunctional metallophosphatase/5'-nucleotidase n=1 Tax=unclassified Paenibacillus TaxID=185978 RepID=UPI0008864AD9|nr:MULTISPECIES: bifunctional UDP-sugar hydrolase/5'-nucleotidase [unclassified Paenibacillus]SDB99170.1 2',3'-cyclic-nucleotide 2'-phosphodiesterase / 3'-nucleotidase [Paenibacillus sp. cl123]SFW69070.1 2',3'-cyclic-nucleotide 2'-phosphodiesterase / 3'-nucleotidase [Paenibacillus sp. UNCCL117]